MSTTLVLSGYVYSAYQNHYITVFFCLAMGVRLLQIQLDGTLLSPEMGNGTVAALKTLQNRNYAVIMQ